MAKIHLFPTLIVTLLAWTQVLHVEGQSATDLKGVDAVAAYHGISSDEVLESEALRMEVCLVGHALRIIQEPGKAVPTYVELPGEESESIESRVLASEFRPVAGEFTWLKTVEGWFVVLPSKERFDVLFERTPFSQQ